MQTGGYTKLLSRILTSTVWLEPHTTVRTWIGFLALCDRSGIVRGSPAGLATIFRVTRLEFDAAIQALTSPDVDSTTKIDEGRRLEIIDGGYRLINFLRIRDEVDAEARREYKRAWMANKRSVDSVVHNNVDIVDNVNKLKMLKKWTQAEAEAEAESRSSTPLRESEHVEPSVVFSNNEKKTKDRGALLKNGEGKETQRATRFAYPQLSESWEQFCKIKRPDLNPAALFDKFRDYWIAVPGAKGRKLDWDATWRNFVRSENHKPDWAKPHDPAAVAREAIHEIEERQRNAKL